EEEPDADHEGIAARGEQVDAESLRALLVVHHLGRDLGRRQLEVEAARIAARGIGGLPGLEGGGDKGTTGPERESAVAAVLPEARRQQPAVGALDGHRRVANVHERGLGGACHLTRILSPQVPVTRRASDAPGDLETPENRRDALETLPILCLVAPQNPWLWRFTLALPTALLLLVFGT